MKVFDIETVCLTEGFKEYFFLRERNPSIDFNRYKNKIGKSLYKFELALQLIHQNRLLN